MDRTLFTPPMIETFRVCRRAYKFAFLEPGEPNSYRNRISTLCKRFLLKALSEIHRSRINNLPQVQKFLGQHWPAEKLAAQNDLEAQERTIQAFRFVYRLLAQYIKTPYRPEKSEVVGVNLKLRARIPHTKAYLEDTFDLILWHPEERKLELVDFHMQPLKPFDPKWPPASIIVRHFLAQRLRARWPFERLAVTFCRLHAEGIEPVSLELDESVIQLHWPEIERTIEAMKNELEFAPHRSAHCKRCHFLSECLAMGQEPPSEDSKQSVCKSA